MMVDVLSPRKAVGLAMLIPAGTLFLLYLFRLLYVLAGDRHVGARGAVD